MIVVDDRLSLAALGGGSQLGDGPWATTWGFHYRLLRALGDDTRVGSLSRVSTRALREAARFPRADRLLVLDPRDVTDRAASLAVKHHLNLLAAELLAAAQHHDAEVLLSRGNVGRSWERVFELEGVTLRVA